VTIVTYWIVQTSDGYWGRANSQYAAELIAKDQGSNLKRYVVHRIKQAADKPEPFIDGIGSLVHYGDPFNGDVRTGTELVRS